MVFSYSWAHLVNGRYYSTRGHRSIQSLLVKWVLESSSSLTSWREDLLPQGHTASPLEGPLRRISFLGIYWQLNSKLPGSMDLLSLSYIHSAFQALCTKSRFSRSIELHLAPYSKCFFMKYSNWDV